MATSIRPAASQEHASTDAPSPDAATGAGVEHAAGTPSTSAVLGKRMTAAALVLAPLLIAVSDAGYALATRDGGSDATGAESVVLMQGHPELIMLSTQTALAACLLMVPAAFAAGNLASRRSPKLAISGGWLMGLGYIAYFGVVATMLLQLATVAQGKALDSFATAMDAAQSGPGSVWIFLLFVVGNMLGTALLGTALLRAKAIPAWAAWPIIAWPAFHITGLVAGIEWFEVAGALCIMVGFSQVARKILQK